MQLSEFNGIRIEIRRKIKEIFGNINIVVAKELTKIHETE
mgnify:FL=1